MTTSPPPVPAPGTRLPTLSQPVSATTIVLGALASRDWRPMHHDADFARERNGVRDIFLNTPNQAMWIERCITDWLGIRARIGRLGFRMTRPVFPRELMEISARVTDVSDGVGLAWVGLEIDVLADGEPSTSAHARVAVPRNEHENPWSLTGDDWTP